MQVALDMGTINIDNREVANFIQNKSVDELKIIFINLLTKQLENSPKKPKHKWSEFGMNMSGLINEKTADELIGSSREFRENFEFRDLDGTE